jgi:predicted GNAT family acetyltransferase
MLVTLARYKDKIIGIAGACADCKTMWQIRVDVLQPYRGKGLAAVLVNMLTLEILSRGYIPYYFTDISTVISQHVAVRAGYFPAWAHCYKTRLDGLLL